MTDRALCVKEVCEHYGVGEGTVLGWIRSGQLRALNVGRRLGARKPRWKITREAVEAFELLRTHSPPPPTTRRRKSSPEVIEFY